MKWSKSPSEAGWYWYWSKLSPRTPPCIVRLTWGVSGDGGEPELRDGEEGWVRDDHNALWWGPLAPPPTTEANPCDD